MAAFVPIENVANHFAVSISTVRAWIRTNKIPSDTYIKVGSTYRFKLPELEAELLGKPVSVEEQAPQGDMMYEQLELDLDDDA
tara:strand:+ start:43 stop:291 length:249 start_codon:yes stop_codon:yes gene_type:complete